VVSTSLLKPGMTRGDLPLVAEHGHMSSKRKFDQKGVVNIEK